MTLIEVAVFAMLVGSMLFVTIIGIGALRRRWRGELGPPFEDELG
jgi:hypothetical protein